MQQQKNETIPGGAYIQGDSVINAKGEKIGDLGKDGKIAMIGAFEPLTVEEALARVQAGDVSDEVLNSLKTHQAAIAAAQATEETEKPLAKMTKAELVAYAEKIGVTVTPDSQTNKQIIEAIEAAKPE